MVGVQVSLIIALRISKQHNISWPMLLMAALSATLLAAGVRRHYWDIYTHRTVRGISFLFVGIDAAGDLFSLVSMFLQPKLDVAGMIIYGAELELWLGVFACGGYFNLMPWSKDQARRFKSRRIQRDESQDHTSSENRPPTNVPTTGVALRGLPSSTSVFRTPSNEIAHYRANIARASLSSESGHPGA